MRKFLQQTVSSSRVSLCYLYVVVWVPVGIEDDDGVCCGQVNAQASRSGGEQETELTSTGGWKETDRRGVREKKLILSTTISEKI